MFQLIPFALGIVSGAIAVRVARSGKAREGLAIACDGLQKTRSSLRNATVSGLEALEQGSAKVREKLSAPADEVPTNDTPAVTAPAAAAAKPRRRSVSAAAGAPSKSRSRKPAAAKDEA